MRTTARNKIRKRQTRRRSAMNQRDVSRSMRKQINRSAKQLRRNEYRSRVPEMPEEQADMRTGRTVETRAVIVSPTGTRHRPLKRKIRRVARSRAKSPAIGRRKESRK